MTVASEASSGISSTNWLYKNKEHGKTSAAASLVCQFTFILALLWLSLSYNMNVILPWLLGYDPSLGR